MKKIIVRRAEEADIPLLARARVDFMKEIWPEAGLDTIAASYPETEEYVRRNTEEGRHLGYLLFEDTELAASASFLLYELPPMPGNVSRVFGYVLNFFTYEEFRRRGYGRRMMEFMVADAKKRGLFKLVLNATPDGEALYRSLGYGEPNHPFLELGLQ